MPWQTVEIGKNMLGATGTEMRDVKEKEKGAYQADILYTALVPAAKRRNPTLLLVARSGITQDMVG
ncbi:hypothetical protein AJ80_00354 [Polytolypa hystricis UAMH7299]|uniref:Uncharacterized protein n=1 Tax=Polytolypa hystricis (strain UAMH7299) TaxID=1447883 RepID=A0A2B7Z2E4_POLH7|nr:hypothetical protein AJ80_00354 [Polytolypa hystricis UAMH7299]